MNIVWENGKETSGKQRPQPRVERRSRRRDERDQFEDLLFGLSAKVMRAAPDSLDAEIATALRQTGAFLDVQRVTLYEFSDDKSSLVVTHSWVAEGVPPHPPRHVLADFTWSMGRLLGGEPIKFSRVSELPREAVQERKYFKRQGIRSSLSIPLWNGQEVAGVIALNAFRSERKWSELIVRRLAILGEFLHGVLLKRKSLDSLGKARSEIRDLKKNLSEHDFSLEEDAVDCRHFDGIVGKSDALRYVLFKVSQVAPTDAAVLVLGETGTGKDLIARAIHRASPRRERPLVKVNCASLPAPLIESELFGHEKGAFTGAATSRAGRFELADNSTIFLDEIGELPLELQPKLLRVLQDGEFERLGGVRTLKVDVRIIAATNKNLLTEIKEGKFREDLYYRLNVFPITMPPLRQRMEDLPLLVHAIARKLSKKHGKSFASVSAATMRAFGQYSWPGNVRELENILERAFISSSGPQLALAEPLGEGDRQSPDLAGSKWACLEHMEKEYICKVLSETAWKIEGPGGAAGYLGLHPSTLRGRMRKLGIARPK